MWTLDYSLQYHLAKYIFRFYGLTIYHLEITGINTISKKFADKLLSILSRYEFNKEKRIILECIEIILDTEKH